MLRKNLLITLCFGVLGISLYLLKDDLNFVPNTKDWILFITMEAVIQELFQIFKKPKENGTT